MTEVDDFDSRRCRRSYVFTDDHSIAEVETRLQSILAARADVVAATQVGGAFE